MQFLDEPTLRDSFINASRGESRRATVPDLATVPWADLDYFGWRDEKRPGLAYAVVELDGTPTGVRLTTARGEGRRSAVCTWCQDVVVQAPVSLYAARRAGESGRRGNTVGTLICTEFGCSGHVRRTPTLSEVGSAQEWERQMMVDRRIAALQANVATFVRRVRDRS